MSKYIVGKYKNVMLFEQNIASNVTRNQKYKHLTNLNIAKNTQAQLLAPYRNFLNLKKQEFFDFHEMSDGERQKKKAVFRFASNN